jgi:hypothetical protein
MHPDRRDQEDRLARLPDRRPPGTGHHFMGSLSRCACGRSRTLPLSCLQCDLIGRDERREPPCCVAGIADVRVHPSGLLTKRRRHLRRCRDRGQSEQCPGFGRRRLLVGHDALPFPQEWAEFLGNCPCKFCHAFAIICNSEYRFIPRLGRGAEEVGELIV